jgi:hypothetical protein
MRIRDEIRFIYKEIQQINNSLYNFHLKVAQNWGNTRYIIFDSIIESTNLELENNLTVILFYIEYDCTHYVIQYCMHIEGAWFV